jgi:hypothetical protein
VLLAGGLVGPLPAARLCSCCSMSCGGASGRPSLHARGAVFRPTEEGLLMKNLLVVLVLLVAVAIGLGFYLG